MTIKETIDLAVFAVKKYRDNETNRKGSLLEYYSITDLSPQALAKQALKLKLCSSATALLNFSEDQCWNQKELDIKNRFKHFHSFNGVELTQDDKLSIYERVSSKGYPLLEGIYDKEAYFYANNFDFTKEEMKARIIRAYNNENNYKRICEPSIKSDEKVLKK